MRRQKRIATGDEIQMRCSGTNTSKPTDDRDYNHQESTHMSRGVTGLPPLCGIGEVWVKPLNICALIVTPKKLEILGKTQAKDTWAQAGLQL